MFGFSFNWKVSNVFFYFAIYSRAAQKPVFDLDHAAWISRVARLYHTLTWSTSDFITFLGAPVCVSFTLFCFLSSSSTPFSLSQYFDRWKVCCLFLPAFFLFSGVARSFLRCACWEERVWHYLPGLMYRPKKRIASCEWLISFGIVFAEISTTFPLHHSTVIRKNRMQASAGVKKKNII